MVSTPPEVEIPRREPTKTWSNTPVPVPSERPATPKIFTTYEWCSPDVAPSTLSWLIGAKDCLEDNIPELGRFSFQT